MDSSNAFFAHLYYILQRNKMQNEKYIWWDTIPSATYIYCVIEGLRMFEEMYSSQMEITLFTYHFLREIIANYNDGERKEDFINV